MKTRGNLGKIEEENIKVIFDGECPVCRSLKSLYESKGAQIPVDFIDARKLGEDELATVSNRSDLNHGIEVQEQGEYSNGPKATQRLMRLSNSRVLRAIAKSDTLTRLGYWMLVHIRRIILRMLNRKSL